MRLVHGTQIKEALRGVAPRRVAVAYIGQDWQSFLGDGTLQDIIVSPTAGSSPDAIADLVRILTWEHVHFLDELHAKVYIGASSAAVGSFNLSANGLSGHALFECGYIVDGEDNLAQLQALYDKLRSAAQQQYPTQPDKENQLLVLKGIAEKLSRAGMQRDRATGSRSLADYEPVTDTDFYCAYHLPEAVEYNADAMRKHAPELFATGVTDAAGLAAKALPFAAKDDVHPGQWLLAWQADEDGAVPAKLSAYWIYINAVIPHGAVDETGTYTKLAVQWAGKGGFGSAPFTIGRAENAALRQVLASGAFPEFMPSPAGKTWWLKRTFPRFRAFVAAWQEARKALSATV